MAGTAAFLPQGRALRRAAVKVVLITGTHEQAFDRLVVAADRLATAGHEVFVQYGHASAPPVRADGAMWVDRAELQRHCQLAAVIITHGGPGSIWDAFAAGKVPIVVPRSHRLGEHVDDHQLAFARHLAKHRRVILVEETERLEQAVADHQASVATCVAPTVASSTHRAQLAAALDAWANEHLAARPRR
ncbi:MAG: glycosyltransferase [Trueperaceae bacterium]|nr:glycosyltransferase [Trueperaceae bacterium]